LVEASNPGDANDPETIAFGKRIREEADDLKLESFGVELCHLIGSVYFTKASSYIRLHSKKTSNILGIPGFFNRLKEKGTVVKEGWSFLTSTMDVQVAMEDMIKKQEKGLLGEEEEKQIEIDLTGKILLVSWRGTSFEVSNVLREVVSVVLSRDKDPTVKDWDTTLMNRAKAILYIGSIFKSVKADESDEERREMERLVMNAGRKKGKGGKDSKPRTPTPGTPSIS